jgi:gamma-glutamyltranspeptidase/glutathione hydrolase
MAEQPEYGTSHISIVDGQGNALAMTTTIEDAFGARQMVKGFLLNNQLTDFSFAPRNAQGKERRNRKHLINPCSNVLSKLLSICRSKIGNLGANSKSRS